MSSIQLRGIRVHNLKNINVDVPHGTLVCISGVSGSGKSSLALDTLYAEGQRRFIESLSAYARQFLERMERPTVDTVTGMLPAIAIESKNTVTNARSTVGTQTEINDYLRLLFARIGITYCPTCGQAVTKDTPRDIAKQILSWPLGSSILITFFISIKESKKYLKGYLQELNKQGFSRIYIGNEICKLSDFGEERKLRKQDSIEVIVDRLTVKSQLKKRLIDSLEIAYKHGKGHVNILRLSDSTLRERLSFSDHFHCATCNLKFQEPTPHMFSFNSPIGACPDCEGFGRSITIDNDLVVPDYNKSIAEGAIAPWATKAAKWEFEQLLTFCRRKRIPITKPWKELPEDDKQRIFEGDDDYFGVDEFFKYLAKKVYKMHVRVFLSRYRSYVTCPTCQGSRLKQHALYVKIANKNIYDLTCMTVDELYDFFQSRLSLSPHEEKIVATVLQEIRSRIRFLKEVGLGYITLDRLSRTLSGGESQRINLASALGANLVDTLYVLDEPSIGLHARDNTLLINILQELKRLGNTVVVIEHDKEMITTADTVIDLGPYAGERGGSIVYAGGVRDLKRCKASLTARYLRGEEKVILDKKYLSPKPMLLTKQRAQRQITIHKATEHNLKKITVSIPLGQLVLITGVSGSGKSTLLYDVLYNNFLRYRGRPIGSVGSVEKIDGLEHIADVVLVDQSPIGRTPRSNPVTFIGAFSLIRNFLAQTRSARLRKMKARHFSFNVEGGRCPVCKGAGKIKVEMHFLADMYVECEACHGCRYKPEVLDVHYNGSNVHDILGMTVADALSFFNGQAALTGKLHILQDVGLGYLKLGQPATTLSAGEAQRLKLALELLEARRNNILFLFDEPTVGLHYHDITYLMKSLEKLLERGNSIVMIEHNLEVIKCADYIIDLGPEGGEAGGEVVVAGIPRTVAHTKCSYTGRFLRDYL